VRRIPAGSVTTREEKACRAYWYDAAVRARCGPLLCGVDEAGRGPLAGPVVAAAVVLPDGLEHAMLYDSKQLTARQREDACSLIVKSALAWGVGVVDPGYIDQYNILQAAFEAMRRALAELPVVPDLVLIDGSSTVPGVRYPQRKLTGGDALSQSVGAASILAKVTRDRIMRALDEQCPGYGFARHMGYGTPEHLDALRRLGPTVWHRFSFAPVRAAAAGNISSGPVRDTDARQALGRRGELAARRYLESLGYSMMAHNWRVKAGEIDLVMIDGDTLVFVEVRTRAHLLAETAWRTGGESVKAQKRERLQRLAQWFLADRGWHWSGPVRFDVVLAADAADSGRLILEHIADAF
jgi:ribonuclease HII